MDSSNPPIPVAKRLWRIVRIVYFMIRKGIISKSKLMLDLRHLMSKRGKLAGKALGNLMFHHHSAAAADHHRHRHLSSSVPPKEYEFSCSNSPALPSYFSRHKHNRRHNYQHNCQPNYFFSPISSADDDVANIATMQKILEMLNSEGASAAASPAVMGVGRSPVVRQLRITDSPFPLRNDDDDDGRVDQQAEQFIEWFHGQLKQQARLTALEVQAHY